MRSAENSEASYHCEAIFPPPSLAAGAGVDALLPTATGAFGGRAGLMWCQCTATDYISVPQLLASMLWQSANPSPSTEGESCGLQSQHFSWNMLWKARAPRLAS